MNTAQHRYFEKGYGGVEWFLAVAFLGLLAYFFIYPLTFRRAAPPSGNSSSAYCRPYVNDDGSIKDDSPEISAPEYDASTVTRGQPFPTIKPTKMVTYRLIKSTVPVKGSSLTHSFSKENMKKIATNEIHCELYEYNGNHHAHFCQWIHEAVTVTPNISKAAKYVVLYPAPYSDGNTTNRYIGASDPYDSEVEADTVFRYGDYQILFLLQLDNNDNPILVGTFENNPYYAIDIYQQVQEDNHTQPTRPLPPNVMTCKDGKTENEALKLGEVIEKSPDKKQEQLGWFVPQQMTLADNWYSPACKPAINLYPTKDTLVNVKITIPNGFLTYTDPLYPKDGWTVLAHPSGDLNYVSNNLKSSKGIVNYPTGVFPYLYYEGKISDQAITKPSTGFVKAYDQLPMFFDELLPKLGLNVKEKEEFKQYWLKALSKSPYYYIGIIPQGQLDQNELLTITPKQDTMIRVRLLFQQLDNPESVQEPQIITPKRNGFTVVDWGAYVKQDKSHPFTCVQ